MSFDKTFEQMLQDRLSKYGMYHWIQKMVDKMKTNTVLKNTPIHVSLHLDGFPNSSTCMDMKSSKVIRITTGLLKLPKSDVKATLAHELGHLIEMKKNPNLLDVVNEKYQAKEMIDDLLLFLIKPLTNKKSCIRILLLTLILISLAIFDKNYYPIGILFFVEFSIFCTCAIFCLLNTWSLYSFQRKLEYQADLYGVKLTSSNVLIKELRDVRKAVDKHCKALNHVLHNEMYESTDYTFAQKLHFESHPTIKQRIKNIKSHC